MKKDVLIVTDYNGLYRQDIYRSQGIDLDAFARRVEEAGHRVRRTTYGRLLQGEVSRWEGQHVFYTSSENMEYKECIKDVVYMLGMRNELVPGFDMLMCHEDKLFQELHKRRLGIRSLDARLYSTLGELKADLGGIAFPVVVKKGEGSGSASVYKARDARELVRIARRAMFDKTVPLFYAKALYKKLSGRLNPHYFEDERYFGRLVLQEYVEGLECDWKVLAFGDKFYALRRRVRRNDFRASGSGLFDFADPGDGILDYARLVYERMDVPFLSMDLCMDGGGAVYLIEFQGVHFGPYTLIESPHYFTHEGGWRKTEARSCLAEEYANAVVKYLEKGPRGGR